MRWPWRSKPQGVGIPEPTSVPPPAGGRRLLLDPSAETADPELPGFLARPDGAPIYYGFPVLDIEVDGFRLGAITDYVGAGTGDGFVIAPDGSRAGLAWHVSEDECFEGVAHPGGDRWGVWSVSFPSIMRSDAEVRAAFSALLPRLRSEWEAWKTQTEAGATRPPRR